MTTPSNLEIHIPQGNGAIKYFKLKPQLPSATEAADWDFIYLNENSGQEQPIADLMIQFSQSSSWLQRQAERCILVVTIDQPGWRFAMNGTKSCLGRQLPQATDALHDVSTEISGNGKVLTATISSASKNSEFIDFSFVAAHVAANGVTTIYQSKDPGIGIDR
ncbi:MAG: DP-EP family protein [Cellvibrionaceae bacterium]|nr:DP-EP family protein [Cellvibrionaceae bacterium]